MNPDSVSAYLAWCTVKSCHTVRVDKGGDSSKYYGLVVNGTFSVFFERTKL